VSELLNFKVFKKDQYGGIEFKEHNNSGWFVSFARINNEKFHGVWGNDFNVDAYEGNLIILSSDNYVDDLDVIIFENEKTSSLECHWRYRGERRFKNLLCKLNFKLEIIEFGMYGEFQYDYKTDKVDKPTKNKFSSLVELLSEIDAYYFYHEFEGY
tara:strand:+ start:5869 stop:6336 length:468 start_codon:yes stop_codon:yes gene_type:complete